MNRLSDLLIQMNRNHLPDDYIQSEVEAFVNDLKLDMEMIEPKPAQLKVQSILFCECETPAQRQSCTYSGSCIPLQE